MGTTRSTRSILIDAPVEQVFAFVADPASLLSALGTSRLGRVRTGASGQITSYEWTAKLALLPREVHGVQTRREVLPNRRIVEEASTGPVLTLELEPAGAATRLTMTEEIATRIPLWNRVMEFIGTQGKGLAHKQGQILDQIKSRVQAGPAASGSSGGE